MIWRWLAIAMAAIAVAPVAFYATAIVWLPVGAVLIGAWR
jgi:hypothetical protein